MSVCLSHMLNKVCSEITCPFPNVNGLIQLSQDAAFSAVIAKVRKNDTLGS